MKVEWKPGMRLLGWDASWTPKGSGAWTLVERTVNAWSVRVLENSPPGGEAVRERMGELLRDWKPDLVAVDLPMATEPVRGYRGADRETTRAFSRYGCPVHSPTPERPGEWGDMIVELLLSHGCRLATGRDFRLPACLEVYPHTAALHMVRASYRLPYKVQRAGGYHPGLPPEERRARVARVFRTLAGRIHEWCEVPEDALAIGETGTLRAWKAAEDRLDALLCVWAGIHALQGDFLPYGDRRGAIWNPNLKGLDPPARIP